VKSGVIGKHQFRILFGRDVQIELAIAAMPRWPSCGLGSQGLRAFRLGPRAGRQPWEQLQSVVGKNGAALFAVQLRACLNLMAANDGEMPPTGLCASFVARQKMSGRM
jgi:hypothetical protein